jgi:hypothetical protein
MVYTVGMDIVLDAVQIETMMERLRRRLAELDEQVEPINLEIGRLKLQLDLLSRLLQSTARTSAMNSQKHRDSSPNQFGKHESIVDIVAGILRDAATPVHIS